MGWWGYLLFAPGQFYATVPDECEYMASRAVGWDASPNFETQTNHLDGNGRTWECLERMKPWASLGRQIPAAVKTMLQSVNIDYAIETAGHAADAGQQQYYIRPGKAHDPTEADPTRPASCRWDISSAFAVAPGTQQRRIGVRVRALSAVLSGAEAKDLLQLDGTSVTRSGSGCASASLDYRLVSQPPTGSNASVALLLNATPGSLQGVQCMHSAFKPPMNLIDARVLCLSIYGDGSNAVLAVELEDSSASVRAFFITIDFKGWRTVRPGAPAARELYTHAGGGVSDATNRPPNNGVNNRHAMRSVSSQAICLYVLSGVCSDKLLACSLNGRRLRPCRCSSPIRLPQKSTLGRLGLWQRRAPRRELAPG